MNQEALHALQDAGLSEVEWAKLNGYADGVWGGDACGCPDDRCIGFHHDGPDDCGCLRELLAGLPR